MIKPRDTSRVPPGGLWVYKNPEDGHLIQHGNYTACRDNARNYRRLNDYPIGQKWNDDFDENVCGNAKPGVCFDFQPPSALQMLSHAAQALYKAAIAGFPVVSQDELQKRKELCEGCQFYNGETGIFAIACRRCGCSKVKLTLATQHCPLSPPKW